MKSFNPVVSVVLVGVFCILPKSAAAQSDLMSLNPSSFYYLSEAKPGWYFDVFAGLEVEATYAGSENTESEVAANARAFYATEAGHRYYLALGEAGGYWTLNDDTQFVAFLEYEEGREAADDPILEGFDDIDATLEGQFSLVRRWGNTYGFLTLQPDLLDRGKGLVWFAALGRDEWFLSDRLRVSVVADLSGADSTYMATEFGITDRESQASGLNSYTPGSGLKSFSTTLEAEYRFGKQWSLLSTLEWERYLDVASDSPLIDEVGNQNNVGVSVMLRYRF